jgi:hypothetical protein
MAGKKQERKKGLFKDPNLIYPGQELYLPS